jgi:TPR repeat protein
MSQALMWGRKAAQEGNIQAQFSVGRTLIESGKPEQQTEGMTYLEQAADAGHRPALLFLATIYAFGRFDQSKDEIRAEALLKPWAEKGDADCQLVLASVYESGNAEKREESALLLQRAADQGNVQAIEILKSRGAEQ